MDDQLQRRADDNRASGEVNWEGVATPLPDSSIVYLARHRANATNLWTDITTQEELANMQADPEQFELRTLFTVPVADLARSPIAHIARARDALDQLERRTAVLQRRVDDRHPGEPLTWEGEFDVLAMKAGFNELQAEVERSQKSSLNFMQIRTDLGAQAVRYIKYLAELAGKIQAGRCRAQGGNTNEEAAGAASQSQAVPSELASLPRYCSGPLSMFQKPDGAWYKVADVQSIFSHSAAKDESSELSHHLRAIAADPMYADHVHAKKSTLLAAADEIDRLSHSAATGIPADAPAAFAKRYTALLCENERLKRRVAELEGASLASPAAPLAGRVEQDAGCWTDDVACDKCGAMGWHVCGAPLAAAVPAEEASELGKLEVLTASEIASRWPSGGMQFVSLDDAHRLFARIDAPMHADATTIDSARFRELVQRVIKSFDGINGHWGKLLIEHIDSVKLAPLAPAEPAPILANARSLMSEKPTRHLSADDLGLSKPTAQGTAQSIDTQEFRELMCHLGYWVDEDDAWNDECGAALVEFINRHIAAQAPAGRDADALLDKAARIARKYVGCDHIAAQIFELKSHAAEQTSLASPSSGDDSSYS